MTLEQLSKDAIEALATGRHHDPFAVLGPHRSGRQLVIRTVQPDADTVVVIDRTHKSVMEMRRIHADGVFEARLPASELDYLFRLNPDSDNTVTEDVYRFPSQLGEIDHHLISEGTHDLLHRCLGAHSLRVQGVDGVNFAVWAPNASRVSVVGVMNNWDGRCHPMRNHPATGVHTPGMISNGNASALLTGVLFSRHR